MNIQQHAAIGIELNERDQEQVTAFVGYMFRQKWLGEVWNWSGPITIKRGQADECAFDFTRCNARGRKRDFVAVVDQDGNALCCITRVFGCGYDFRRVEGRLDDIAKDAFAEWRAAK